MAISYSAVLGKTVKRLAQIRGGGSAFPGLFVEKIDPTFMKRTLATLPEGVVLISGTNGKTTTTKMVVELLESRGMKVFTNRTGSNFTRGVAAALLSEVNMQGLMSADIAVLELDEAHAVHFVNSVKPRYSLLLNVMRDQLDRFGEIDATAKLLEVIARATTDTVTINREDPRLLKIGETLTDQSVVYFGLSKGLESAFPSDDAMRGAKQAESKKIAANVTLESLEDHTATFDIDGSEKTATLKLDGVYNIYNAAAALSLVTIIQKETLDIDSVIVALESVTPAFGRGEVLTVHGKPLELVLVKNPSGFRLGLSSFSAEGYSTMVAINDNYADGRDMSWLWDVDFDSLQNQGVAAVTGVRAYDMALRLQYDDIEIAHVDTNISACLKYFIAENETRPKRIFCTYTAMLAIRRELAKITTVETVS